MLNIFSFPIVIMSNILISIVGLSITSSEMYRKHFIKYSNEQKLVK